MCMVLAYALPPFFWYAPAAIAVITLDNNLIAHEMWHLNLLIAIGAAVAFAWIPLSSTIRKRRIRTDQASR